MTEGASFVLFSLHEAQARQTSTLDKKACACSTTT